MLNKALRCVPVDGDKVSCITVDDLTIHAIERQFGAFPILLNPKDVPVLCGMRSVFTYQVHARPLGYDDRNPYDELASVVAKYGRVLISVEDNELW